MRQRLRGGGSVALIKNILRMTQEHGSPADPTRPLIGKLTDKNKIFYHININPIFAADYKPIFVETSFPASLSAINSRCVDFLKWL
jgi:hypothetical protein